MAGEATFISLPNELLATIFESSGTPPSSLLDIAKLCNRLYFVCLSLYLKINGQRDPEESCSVSLHRIPPQHPTVDVLGALILSSFVTKVSHFRCAFEGCPRPRMLHNMTRVERFINRLDCIGKVVLDFSLLDQKYRNLCDDDIMTWSTTVGKLLNTILERGCTSLEVNGLDQMTDVYSAVVRMPRPPSASLLSSMNFLSLFNPSPPKTSPYPPETILSGPSWRFERSRYQSTTKDQAHILTHLSREAKSQSKLTHFTIASRSLLCPPLLQWTYSVLSFSPITTLFVRNIEFFGPTWSVLTVLLPQSVPTLKHLELSNLESFSHDQITRLMASFPLLERLSVEKLALPWYSGLTSHTIQQNHFPKFKHLREFRVEEHWILPSFQYSFTEEFLPALQNLTVVFHSGEGWKTRLEDDLSPVHVLFTELSSRGSELHFAVNIDVLANADVTSWMRMQRYQKSVADEAGAWIHCVSGVTLTFKGKLEFAHELNAQKTVEAWFDQFPGLRKFAIRTREKDDGTQRSAEEFCRTTMLKVVKALESVEVNGMALIASEG